MQTTAIIVRNELKQGGFLKDADWAQVITSLRHIVHSYNVQQLSKLENNNYLIGVLGNIDESDNVALNLSLKVMTEAFNIQPAYTGTVKETHSNA